MKFMLMLAHDAAAWDAQTAAEKERGLHGHMALIEELTSQGKRIDSRRLRPSSQAKTVRIKNGKPIAIDGPVSETKEVLGGYYVIECASMEEAVEWAKKIPPFGDPAHSCVEVRPIWEREDY
jgi:hypothetical protein